MMSIADKMKKKDGPRKKETGEKGRREGKREEGRENTNDDTF
jgi:hypothetical protein